MTLKEAILTLNANVVFACERAGFDSATVRMVEDALDTIEDALKAQESEAETAEPPMLDDDIGCCWYDITHKFTLEQVVSALIAQKPCEDAVSRMADAPLYVPDAPTIDAIPVEWLDAQIRGYASALKSTELKALVLVKQMWQKEQEGV